MTRLQHFARLSISIVFLLAGAAVHAHDLGLARITLNPLSSDSVRMDAKLPIKLEPASPRVASNCKLHELGQRVHNRLDKTVSWEIECREQHGNNANPVVLDWQREAALIVVVGSDGARTERLINADAGSIRFDLAELLENYNNAASSALHYLQVGVEHILGGIDHLAFVLGLCLIASGWRLLKLVTAFTIGHSLSLAAASLGWVAIPSPPTEALIALSVAFIAREALLPPDQRRHGYPLVVIFGLLHGLGFAGALSELGVTSGNLLSALISFNIGVELGQLLFITLIIASAAVLRRVTEVNLAGARVAVSVLLGSIAFFWTLERISIFILGSIA